MFKRWLVVLFFGFFWVPLSHAQYAWENVERVVAIGDVHGAYPQLVALLRGAGVIDADLRWQGGNTHLVSVGDLLDRGPESRQAMDLLMRLQSEAEAAGGRAHVLLGNHELMNLSGDLRDVSAAERAALTELGGHAAAFAADGKYGRWLLSLPFMIRINDTLFTHGGLPPFVAGTNLQTLNRTAQQDLRTLLSEGQRLREQAVLADGTDLFSIAYHANDEQRTALGAKFMAAAGSQILGDKGLLWYRGTASCHPLLEGPRLSTNLSALGAARVVVGHTPTPDREINARLKQRVYIIDTGMLAEIYNGKPRLLEMSSSRVRALDDKGMPTPITQLPIPDPLQQLSNAKYQPGEKTAGMTPVTFADASTGSFDGQTLSGLFRKLSRRDTNRALAAYRLDRMLGLHMVPATTPRRIGKHNGVVMAWQHRPFSESARQQSNIARRNWCAAGSDFALLAAFDALIGKTDRSANNLFYERGTFNIRITENFRAFGTSSNLPQTVLPPTLPKALVEPLGKLDADSLNGTLEGLLKPREIKAILKRRDAILKWPVSA